MCIPYNLHFISVQPKSSSTPCLMGGICGGAPPIVICSETFISLLWIVMDSYG